MRLIIPQVIVKQQLNYDPATGLFTWVISKNGASKGVLAGTKDKGYIRIMINRKYYMAHVLAWVYVYGYVPAMIDHKNGDKSDNRLCNLRECTPQQNQYNRKNSKNNTTGIKGVYRTQSGKYVAQICKDNKNHHLGTFDNFNDAVTCRELIAKELHGGYYHQTK